MLIAAYIILAIALMQLLTAIINIVFWQRLGNKESEQSDLVSILIPARNEQNNIGRLLKSIQNISYKNIEVIVYNDLSTDNTESIISGFTKSDNRIKIINGTELPFGWLGKNHACYNLAKEAKGEYLCFIDADVNISGNLLENALDKFKKQNLSLMSIFPKQIMNSKGEKATVPIMNYILLTLLPLVFVRCSPFVSHAAANGQFMLFKASDYLKLNPHEKFKGSAVEDIMVARYFKKNKKRVSCLLGDERLTCNMYNNAKESVNGFAKNFFMFFGNSAMLAFVFSIVTILGIIPLIYTNVNYAFAYLIVVVFTRILVSLASNQSVINNIIYMPIQLYFLMRITIRAFAARHRNYLNWKGRNVYAIKD